MIAEIGHYALILALAMAIVQGTLPLAGTATCWSAGEPPVVSLLAGHQGRRSAMDDLTGRETVSWFPPILVKRRLFPRKMVTF